MAVVMSCSTLSSLADDTASSSSAAAPLAQEQSPVILMHSIDAAVDHDDPLKSSETRVHSSDELLPLDADQKQQLIDYIAALEGSDSNGVYRFDFDAGNHFRKEAKVDDGRVQGEFGFHGGDGFLRVLEYEADAHGKFRVLSHKRIPTQDKRGQVPKLAEVSFDTPENVAADGPSFESNREVTPSPSANNNNNNRGSSGAVSAASFKDPSSASGNADRQAIADDAVSFSASSSAQQWRFTTPSVIGRQDRRLFQGLPNLGDIDFGQITPLQLPQRIYDRLHSRGPYVAHQEDVKYAFALNLEDHMNELELEGLVALPHVPPVDITSINASPNKSRKNGVVGSAGNNGRIRSKQQQQLNRPFQRGGNSLRRRKRQNASSPAADFRTKKEKQETYGFGFQAPFHGHEEKGFDDGSKKGTFYWDGPDGYRRIVTYTADERGFRPKIVKVPIPTPPPPTPSPIRPQPGRREGRELGENDSDFVIDDEGRKLRRSKESRPYKFSYNVGTHYHVEEGFANGTRIGEYAIVQPDGRKRTVTYVADDGGFRPKVNYADATPDELAGKLRLPKALVIPAELFAQKPLAVNAVDFVLDFRQNQKKIVVARLVPKSEASSKPAVTPVNARENEVNNDDTSSSFGARRGRLNNEKIAATTENSVFPFSPRSQRRVSGTRNFRDPIGNVLKFSEPIATSPTPSPAGTFVRQNNGDTIKTSNEIPQDLESLRLNQLRRQEVGRLQVIRKVQANEKRRTSAGTSSATSPGTGNESFGVRSSGRQRVQVTRQQIAQQQQQQGQSPAPRQQQVTSGGDRSQFQRAIQSFNPVQQPVFGQRLVARRPIGVSRQEIQQLQQQQQLLQQRQQQSPTPIIPVPILSNVPGQKEEEFELPNFVPLTVGVASRGKDAIAGSKDVSAGKSSTLRKRPANSQQDFTSNFQPTLVSRQRFTPGKFSTNSLPVTDPAITTFRPTTSRLAAVQDTATFAAFKQPEQQQRRRQQQQQVFFSTTTFAPATATRFSVLPTETIPTTTEQPATTTRFQQLAFRKQQSSLAFRSPVNSLRFSNPILTETTTTTAAATTPVSIFTFRPTTNRPTTLPRFTTQPTRLFTNKPQPPFRSPQNSFAQARSLFPATGQPSTARTFPTTTFVTQEVTTTERITVPRQTTTFAPQTTNAPFTTTFRTWPTTTRQQDRASTSAYSFWNPSTTTRRTPPSTTVNSFEVQETTANKDVPFTFATTTAARPRPSTTTRRPVPSSAAAAVRRQGKALALPIDPIRDIPRQTNAIFLGARIESSAGRDKDIDVPPYKFSYDVGTHYHEEESDAGGRVVRGKYGIVDANGILRETEYYVDETGFHPIVRRKNLRALQQQNSA